MALFEGEEMIDVPTPDGRVLKLPRSIVPSSMLPQQQIAAAPPLAPAALPMPTPGTPPEPEPESVTGGALPAPPMALPPNAGPVQNSPDYSAGTIDQEALAKQRGAQIKKQAAKEKAAAAQAATPAGQVSDAVAKREAAIKEQEQAGISAADTEAASQLLIADAYKTRNEDLDKLFAKRQQEAEADLVEQKQKLSSMESLKKKIAGAKIDRQHDHPIIAAIGVILAGLGSAWKGEGDKNPALEIYQKAIDRKVAAQMEAIEQQKTILGFTRDELAELRNTAQSKLALNNILISGESEKAARQVEEIAARSSSEKVKANAQILAAQLRERSETLKLDAAQKQLEYDQRERHQKQQINLGYAGIAQQRYATDLNAQVDRERIAADLQKSLAAANAQGGEAAMKAKLEMLKDNETRGVRNLISKQPLLTKAGREMMEQATQLEEQATQLEEQAKADPMGFSVSGGKEKVAKMREQASAMRGDAMISGQVRARDPNQAGQIGKKWSAGQSMIQLIDEINDLYDKEQRGYITRSAAQEAIQAKTTLLALRGKEAWQLGAWDKGAERITEKIVPLDPTSGWDVGILGGALNRERIKDPEGFKKRLEAVATSLQQDLENDLSANTTWDDSGKLFSRKTWANLNTPENKASAKLTQERTPSEKTADIESRGTVRETIGQMGQSIYRKPTTKEEDAARVPGSTTYVGLSKEQEQPFDTLLQAYKSGKPGAGDELVAKVVNNASDRPALAIALMHNLREHAPKELYAKARSALPPDSEVAKQMDQEEKSRIGPAMVPTRMLRAQVLNSIGPDGKVADDAGYRELAQRAKKDPAAAEAILEIVRQSGANKTLPKGSVFREGR